MLLVWAQVPKPLQRSSVQTFESVEQGVMLLAWASAGHAGAPLQMHGSPRCELHVPALHVSAPLQNKPSLHGPALAEWAHVPLPLQRSSVQTFESDEQEVTALAKPLAGHEAALPLQTSATSHSPLEARQVTDVPAYASTGHADERPLQVSATSQIPEAARHVLPVEKPFAGQVVDVPVQVSATSQAPTTPRQRVAALAKQSSVASLHVLPQMPPPVQGLPAWTEQVPPEQVSAPLQ